MATFMLLLLFALQGFCTYTLKQATTVLDNSQAVISANGEVVKAGERQQGMIRRHDLELTGDLEVTTSKEPSVTSDKLAEDNKAKDPAAYGVMDEKDRNAKVLAGMSHNVTDADYEAPAWAAHASMPEMPMDKCTKDVHEDMGLSDYGRIRHSCSSCKNECTEGTSQKGVKMTWHMEPALSSCNAFDVKFYTNWSNVDQLACEDCTGKGIRHALEFEIGSNAGDSNAGQSEPLSFNGWMGPEIVGGPTVAGSSFAGKHVVEVADTMEPSHSADCEHAEEAGRWYAIPGELKAGESFKCERVCEGAFCDKNDCNYKTHVRCESTIAMSTNQLFSYRVRMAAESSTGTLDGVEYTGSEWEIEAQEISASAQDIQASTKAGTIVGRVILAGNAAKYGIQKLSQTHSHIGCVHCDLFYESTIVTGPFIDLPKGAHAVRSADGSPPDLTPESCELFRISSLGGFAVRFETGPGLWPAYEINDTIFSCSHNAESTCPAPVELTAANKTDASIAPAATAPAAAAAAASKTEAVAAAAAAAAASKAEAVTPAAASAAADKTEAAEIAADVAAAAAAPATSTSL